MAIAKNWVFTDFDLESKDEWQTNNDAIRYIYVGPNEKCPTTGKEHYHGYIQLVKKKRLAWIQKHIKNGPHYENARGTLAEGKLYANKDGGTDFYERGEPVFERQRTDLDPLRVRVNDAHRSGESREFIMQSLTTINQQNFVRNLWPYRQRPARPEGLLEVHWIYGESSTGKSTRAGEYLPKGQTWRLNFDGKFMRGYDQQYYIWFEEFKVHHLPYEKLLELTDSEAIERGDCTVATLYSGAMVWNPKVIVISTLQSPAEMYADTESMPLFQLVRRLDTIQHCTKVYPNRVKETKYITHN